MKTPNNKKSTQQLETLLHQQAEKIAQLERGQAIDAAIERIRAKALAMHHSYEVKDVANAMRTELMNLGITGVSAATIWVEQSKDKVRAWDFTNVQEVADSKDLGVDLVLDLEKGRTHPKAYFWNVWNNRNETYSVVASNMETLYASMNWLVELDETMGKELLHLLDTRQLTYWWHASAAIKKGTITIDFVAPPPVEMAIILPKMATAFDLAYRRFEDLQKAEAQAREAQIEAALERVRAKTMAMHKTEDLRAVVGVLYEQFNLLHLADEGCNINIFKKDINSIESWMAGFDGISLPDCYYMEGIGHPFLKRMWDTWKAQAAPFHITSAGKELNDYVKYILEETGLKRIPDDFKEMMLSSPELHFSFITFKYGQIEIVNTSTSPSQENLQVLTRFAKVFEQTYTRFLDIQKAEAQAKEAQIEAALERVRARTMAMHKSEELSKVATAMFTEFYQLGLINEIARTVININDEENGDCEMWLTQIGGAELRNHFQYNYLENELWEAEYRAYQQVAKNKRKEHKYIVTHEGKAFEELMAFGIEKKLITPEDFKIIKEEGIQKWIEHIVWFAYGSLVIARDSPLSEDGFNILQRFAAVFEQTYTRFLDLQKAEAQAKEAQIEAALERVRSASMAMHNSSELQQVVQVMFEQMQSFGISSHATLIEIFDAENGLIDCWFADHLNSYHITHYEIKGKKNHTIIKMWTCWKEQQPSMTIHLKGAKKKKYDTYLLTETGFNQIPDALKKDIRSSKEGYFTYCSMRYGLIQVVDIHPIPAKNIAIIQRFAKVFEQAYTRFLDIQKAETQAKEAQIEAALERVRSKSMAMHKSDELREVVATVYQQLNGLGFGAYGCAIVTDEKERNGYNMWMANTNQNLLPTVYFMPHFEHPLYDQFVSGYQSKVPFFTVELKGQLKKSYDKIVFSETDFKNLPAEIKQMMQSHEESYTCSANFEQGFLQTQGLEPLPEDKVVILQRFARVFEQSYVRFLDLQKAEAQAKEAQIEAALERVRSRTMAMHRSEELNEVVGVLYQQFAQLTNNWGIELGIFNKRETTIEIFRSNIETAAYPKSYFIKGKGHRVLKQYWQIWKDQTANTLITLKGKAQKNFLQYLLTHTDFKDLPESDKKVMKVPQVHLQFAPMQYGFLMVATIDAPFQQEDFAILNRFAKVFEQTYTRFLDIQKAEAQAREAQIEASLERVRAASMAMHNSDELSDVASVLFGEIKSLTGLDIDRCYVNIPDIQAGIIKIWYTNEKGQSEGNSWITTIDGHHFAQKLFDSWLSQTRFELVLEPEYLKDWVKYALKRGFKLQQDAKAPTVMHSFGVSFKQGLITIMSERLATEYEKNVIHRFAHIFQQSYTRFLDLQKAEEQVREAQIEAALERVRAASMAMHHSNELMEVTNMLFEQMHNIGLKAVSSWISLINVEADALEMWLRHEESEVAAQIVSGKDHPNFRTDIDAWKKKDASIKFADDKADFIFAMKHLFGFEIYNHPDKSHFHLLEVYHRFGWLGLGTWDETTAEEIEICNRFANVFEQTYTRFLDLQKAEAQAREAQIEAALERVRSRTMAMHKSEELREASQVLFEQMKSIGIKAESTAITLVFPKNDAMEIWVSTGNEFAVRNVKGSDHPNFRLEIESWKIGEELIRIQNPKADFINAVKQIFDFNIEDRKEATTFHLLHIRHQFGFLSLGSWEEVKNANIDIYRRFASVFEQTYTRFLDLQKAEERAREAQIEAALERVRARAMSMRHSDELSEAAELLYHEFFKLGVEPFSCGYLINDEEKGEWRIWLTNPGEPFFKEYWTIPYTADHNLQARYKSWKNKEAFHCAVLEGAANQAHHQVICQYAPWKEEVTETLAPQLVFNSAHFSLGHLLVISPDRLTSELEQAMVRFASVFDLTYRRFLDLEKAEEQNRQLEKVFNENQRLLHSILPEQIAEQIRKGQKTVVKRFEEVSILFADIVGFTILSEKLSPQKVVDILNGLFSKFDDLTDKYQLEKIKTIGDAYMVAAGVPEEKDNHAQLMFAFAKEMLQTLQAFNQAMGGNLKIRIGISSGPVVAGVIGKKKFAYDLWGDTVNTAARMEANGRADCIQVSPMTYAILKKETAFEKIPNVEIKGKGMMDVYLWTPSFTG